MNHVLNKSNVDIAELDERGKLDHYRVQGVILERFLINVQQATFNVICLAQSVETQLEDGSKKITPQVGTLNFSATVGRYFDSMIYCSMQNASHKFGSSTSYQTKVQTGSRSDIEIEKEKVPSLKKFFDGSLVVPEEAGKKAVVQLLRPPTLDTSRLEKEIVAENLAPMEVTTTPPQQTTTDRLSLLASLKKGK
jgi:hypothetical protein